MQMVGPTVVCCLNPYVQSTFTIPKHIVVTWINFYRLYTIMLLGILKYYYPVYAAVIDWFALLHVPILLGCIILFCIRTNQ